jgi:hypothetical protein
MDIIEYVLRQFRELPAHRWKGSSNADKTLTILDHKAGVDFARGPWVKFKVKENEAEHTIQGYLNRTERIKIDDTEVDNDDVQFDAAANGLPPNVELKIVIKFVFTQNGKKRTFRFEGVTN